MHNNKDNFKANGPATKDCIKNRFDIFLRVVHSDQYSKIQLPIQTHSNSALVITLAEAAESTKDRKLTVVTL